MVEAAACKLVAAEGYLDRNLTSHYSLTISTTYIRTALYYVSIRGVCWLPYAQESPRRRCAESCYNNNFVSVHRNHHVIIARADPASRITPPFHRDAVLCARPMGR